MGAAVIYGQLYVEYQLITGLFREPYYTVPEIIRLYVGIRRTTSQTFAAVISTAKILPWSVDRGRLVVDYPS